MANMPKTSQSFVLINLLMEHKKIGNIVCFCQKLDLNSSQNTTRNVIYYNKLSPNQFYYSFYRHSLQD